MIDETYLIPTLLAVFCFYHEENSLLVGEKFEFQLDEFDKIGKVSERTCEGYNPMNDPTTNKVTRKIDERHVKLLCWLCLHFLECIKPFKVYKAFRMNQAPLMSGVTYDDLAFLVLTLEHHAKKWLEMMKKMEEGNQGQLTKEHTKELGKAHCKYTGNGVSGPEGQQRFVELKTYFVNLIRADKANGSGTVTEQINSMFQVMLETAGDADKYAPPSDAKKPSKRQKIEPAFNHDMEAMFEASMQTLDATNVTAFAI